MDPEYSRNSIARALALTSLVVCVSTAACGYTEQQMQAQLVQVAQLKAALDVLETHDTVCQERVHALEQRAPAAPDAPPPPAAPDGGTP